MQQAHLHAHAPFRTSLLMMQLVPYEPIWMSFSTLSSKIQLVSRISFQ